MKYICILLFLANGGDCDLFEHLDLSKFRVHNAGVQTVSAQQLIDTVLSYAEYTASANYSKSKSPYPWEDSSQMADREKAAIAIVNFDLLVDGKDSFHIKTVNNKLIIEASSGVTAAWGLNYFLKKYCDSHMGWQVENIQWPTTLPAVDEIVVANDKFRYYQNVCTYSYSFIWWGEREWTKHLVWMAMNGINLALAPMGQEAIWKEIYEEVGMTQDEIDEHFTGPAFLSWLRMGNIRGWGGPLPSEWHKRSVHLQKFVIDRMVKLGMIPVLPAFAGHVPRAFARIYPNVTFNSMAVWNNFNDDYCCPLFIDPNEPLFEEIGVRFLSKINSTFGTFHVYNSDPFNEVTSSSWSTAFVENVAKSIFSSMLKVDPDGVWLLQNWMFVHDPVLWPLDRVKSFLTSVPLGRILVLDLQSEQWPQYELYQMYFGQPFIWCMLHNFGGTLGMFGNTHSINNDVYSARNLRNSTMVGIGLTPEGINQNYMVYDLMMESGWRKEPVDLVSWVEKYAERRYGCGTQLSRAWRYLLKSVYDFRGLNKMRGKYVMVKVPSFKHKPWAWYKSHDLMEAWKEFISSNCSSDAFLHDLTDVTRQALQYRAEQQYLNLLDNLNYLWPFQESMNEFLDILTDMQYVLERNIDFSAKSWLGTGFNGNPLTLINAKNQITLWGPNGEIVDYANKQWYELFKLYFIPRWKAFLEAYTTSLTTNEPFNEKVVQTAVKKAVEKDFKGFWDSCCTQRDYDSNTIESVKSVTNMAFARWYTLPDAKDLPQSIIWPDPKRTAPPDVSASEGFTPSVIMQRSTDDSRDDVLCIGKLCSL